MSTGNLHGIGKNLPAAGRRRGGIARLGGDRSSARGPRRTLKIRGNGSELTTLYHPLSGLLAETVYFVHFRVKRTPSGPSGSSDELRVEIVDAIDGSVTTDPAGASKCLVIDAKAIATAVHESKWFSFRLRRTMTQPAYLRLRISCPLAADATLYIDEMAVAAGREPFKGSPQRVPLTPTATISCRSEADPPQAEIAADRCWAGRRTGGPAFER